MSSQRFVVLITGGSRGIGEATSLALAGRKIITIVINYCSDDSSAAATAEKCKAAGAAQVFLIKANLKLEIECQRLIKETIEKAGRLDVLVLNHGIFIEHDIGGEDSDNFEEWIAKSKETIQVNYNSCAALGYLAIKQFLAQNDADSNKTFAPKLKEAETAALGESNGRIISVTSRAAVRGELTTPSYAASKAALSIFTQSLARRFAADKVAAFVVAPGWIATEMSKEEMANNGPAVLAQHPLGRISEPSEVADLIKFCSLDAPLAMTGTVLDVNGASYLSH